MIQKSALLVLLGLALVVFFPACSSCGGDVAVEKPAAAVQPPPQAPTGGEKAAPDAAGRSETDMEKEAGELATKESPDLPAPKPGIAVKESADKPPKEVKPSAPVPAPKVDLLSKPTLDYPASPSEFKVRFETTKGNFVVRLVRDWSPGGVDHFHYLVQAGYYSDIAFFRVIEGFMVQFGMHGDPKINDLWSNTSLKDEPVKVSNKRGFLTYAKTNRPNSRSIQLFINLVDNPNLDSMGFSPIGEVLEGMDVVDSLYSGYGEGAPRGRGPSQGLIAQQGNSYLKQQFPKLDYIQKVALMK
jgi:peptidyl-prolyl cis-trans isomerase A (cyclophilin A)